MKILSAFRRTTSETTEDSLEPEAQQERQTPDAAPDQFRVLPLYQLERNPSQPRSMADEEKLEELIAANFIKKDSFARPNCSTFVTADGL